MDARNAEFQQQLKEKDDEINRLRKELETLKVHIGIRHQNRVHKSIAEMRLHASLQLITVFCFLHD